MKVLRKLRGTDDVDNEITELKQEQNKSREIQHMTVLEVCTEESLYFYAEYLIEYGIFEYGYLKFCISRFLFRLTVTNIIF